MNKESLARSVKLFLGSVCVYGVVAACSAASSGGGGGAGAGSGDPFVDPVTGANAAPPTVVVAQCDKQSDGWYYAEHAFPGKSVTDLARTAVLYNGAKGIQGYTQAIGFSGAFGAASVWVRDGSVMVLCGLTSGNQDGKITSVTIVVP